MTAYAVITYNYGDTGQASDLDELARYAVIIALQEVADRKKEIRGFLQRHPGWAVYVGGLPGAPADVLLVNVDAIGPVTVFNHPGVGRRFLGPKGNGPLWSKPKPITQYVLQDGTSLFDLHTLPSVTKSKAALGPKEWARRRKHHHDYLAALLDVVHTLDGPVVVCGDFNSEKDFELNQPLIDAGFVGWTNVPTRDGRSIDHILYLAERGTTGNESVTVGGTHSDHKPVLKTLTQEEGHAVPTITQRVARNARGRGLTVLNREEWGSDPDGRKWPLAPDVDNVYIWRREHKPHSLLPDRPVDTVWQHITDTFDTGELTGDFKKDMQLVERVGFGRFGTGLSYNWLVDMETGMVGVGQPMDAKGAHTLMDIPRAGYSHDQNAVSIAIAVIGRPDDRLSDAAENAIATLIAAAIEEGSVTPGFDYNPHSFAAHKACPCDSTRDKMPAIRATAVAASKRKR